MFCTSKERETCDVEKQTCTGCYYENETPEKKIERLEIVKDMLDGELKLLRKELQQEKEKNKELEKVINMMTEDICIYATENHYSAVRRNFGNDSVYIRPKETMKEYYFKKARGESNE